MKKEINTNGYEYVDLGLPSGTLWAACNIGATKPEESGLFFQWGSVNGYAGDNAKKHSTWQTTPFNWGMNDFNLDFQSLKKLVCPGGILPPKYDAAHIHMGGDWKMPTIAQFKELLCYTIHEWVTVNGINGKKLTSKTDPSNYIFIPASGCNYSGNGYGDEHWGRLWSSSLDESYLANAWELNFDSCDYNFGSSHRCAGFCVRGVID